MATVQIWLGSHGPYFFDDTETYRDDPTITFQSFRSTGSTLIQGSHYFNDSDVHITRDGGDLKFTDLSTGTKTLADLAITGPLDAIRGDAADRRLRISRLTIWDGTATDSIKCNFNSVFNGLTTSQVDNILANGVEVSGYTLDAQGDTLIIKNSVMSDHPIAIIPVTTRNNSGTLFTIFPSTSISTGTITMTFTRPDGSAVYLPGLVDVDYLSVTLLYITSA